MADILLDHDFLRLHKITIATWEEEMNRFYCPTLLQFLSSDHLYFVPFYSNTLQPIANHDHYAPQMNILSIPRPTI